MEIRVDLSKKISDLPPGTGDRRTRIIGLLAGEVVANFECSNAFLVEGKAIARMILLHWRCKIPKPNCGRRIWLRYWNSNRKYLLAQPAHSHRKLLLVKCLTRLMWQATRDLKILADGTSDAISAKKSYWKQVAFEKESRWLMQPVQPRDSQYSNGTQHGSANEEIATRIPVLMYHSVAAAGDPRLNQWRIHPAVLEEQLEFLKDRGYYGITSRDLRDSLSGKNPLRGKPILLSFDDGLKDFSVNGWPIIKKHGFTAEMFVVTDYVGTKSNWDPVSLYAGELMSWTDIRALHDDGMEFGSHLATHRYATRLSMDELFEECVRSRASLQYHLGIEVCSMAMPYGNWDWRLVRVLEWAGYDMGYTVKNGKVSQGMNKLLLPRVEVEGGMDIQAFEQLLLDA